MRQHGHKALRLMAGLGYVITVTLWAGCGPPPVKKVTNPDPAGKIPAIKRAARTQDRRVVPQLVKDLESDDPAVRFFAIEGLRRLTGQTFGYVYHGDEEKRAAAVKSWQEWLEGRLQHAAQAQPARRGRSGRD